MFTNFVFIFIILLQIKRIESYFVSVGDYSKESIPGLNEPGCGLSAQQIVIDLSLNNNCFQRKYGNKTFVLFEKPKVKPQINQRIYKGVDVRHAYESPWVVFIARTQRLREGGTCTGVLISTYWVLTAAHCFTNRNIEIFDGFLLTMGSKTRKGIKRIHVEKRSFYTHPMYTNPSDPNLIGPLTEEQHERIKNRHDMALIRVSGFIPNTTYDNKYFINTICLPYRHQVNYGIENATFYGYGYINDKYKHPDYLQIGWVQLTPYNWCDKFFCGHFLDDVPRPCAGDSGGPLVQYFPGFENRAVLLGILRGGWPANATCSNQRKIGYWIPVSKHMDWILKTMKENYP